MDEDMMEAILMGMQPSKTKQLSRSLKAQTGLGDLASLSLNDRTAKWGGNFGGRAMDTAGNLGKAEQDRALAAQQELYNRDRMAQQQQQFERTQAEVELSNRRDYALRRAAAQLAAGRASADEDGILSTKDLNKQVGDISKAVEKAGLPAMDEAQRIYNQTLSKYTDEAGNLKGDLPGIGMTGMLPSGLLSKEGRAVRQDVAQIRTQVLKAMSGAAVTEPEAARLYEQIGLYLGGSDEDVIRGLGMLNATQQARKQNIFSGAHPSAVEEYQRRRIANAPQSNGVENYDKYFLDTP